MESREVLSVYPCKDETLTLSIADKNNKKDREIWTACYRISSNNSGEKVIQLLPRTMARRGGKASQIQKMSIPCWDVFTSLHTYLHQS